MGSESHSHEQGSTQSDTKSTLKRNILFGGSVATIAYIAETPIEHWLDESVLNQVAFFGGTVALMGGLCMALLRKNSNNTPPNQNGNYPS